MSNDYEPPMPETVHFQSTTGVDCIAYWAFDVFGLNMRSCQVNLLDGDKLIVQPMPFGARVSTERGSSGEVVVWFDTDIESASKIEYLYDSRKAPIAS